MVQFEKIYFLKLKTSTQIQAMVLHDVWSFFFIKYDNSFKFDILTGNFSKNKKKNSIFE